MSWVLLVNAGATLYMMGLIWFVQVVHYPLFVGVGHDRFATYEAKHQRLTTLVVAPPMTIELVTGVMLVWLRPPGVGMSWAIIGVALIGVIWLSTALVQVPQHRALAGGFRARPHALLVGTNWVRTVAWSLRGALVLWMISATMR